MEPTGVKRKLSVILAADVEGYSRLMGVDEEATHKTPSAYRRICQSLIALAVALVLALPGVSALTAETPKRGGILTFVVGAAGPPDLCQLRLVGGLVQNGMSAHVCKFDIHVSAFEHARTYQFPAAGGFNSDNAH